MAKTQKATMAFKGNTRTAIRMAIQGLTRVQSYDSSLRVGSGLPLVFPLGGPINPGEIIAALNACLPQTYPPAVNPA